MDDTDNVDTLIREIETRGLPYEAQGPATVRVFTGTSDVVMTSVPLLAEATEPTGILAENGDGASAIVMRNGNALFVVRRNPGVWEHFVAPGGPSAILGSWKNGERTRFRQRHGALWQAIPEARELAEQLGLGEDLPAEVAPPPPAPKAEKPAKAARTRSTAPKTPRVPKASTKKVAEPEPAPALCPRCFTVLPLTGRCDCS